MVRRRTRTAKQATLNNGVSVVMSANVLEEHYFASPKRKDCKVDHSEVLHCAKLGRTKAERNATKKIGLPLATRSQAKTIENFFKTKTANANNEDELEIEKESLFSPPLPCNALHIVSHHLSFAERTSQDGYIFELSEDTNGEETDQTEASDETETIASHDSKNKTENIFLQEPVLKLDIDKTLNQASSIKINKSIDIEPVFSSPPALAASVLHGRFNQIVSLNGCASDAVKILSPSKRASSAFDMGSSPQINNSFLLLPEIDNSSCDSGVGFTSSVDNNDKSNNNMPDISSFVNGNQSATRRQKPATPHRILCPSPTKAAPRTNSHNGRVISPSSPRKKEQLLSPRKSPRHIPNVATVKSKTRRKLNPTPPQQTEKAPYKRETVKTAVLNGYKHEDKSIDTCADTNSEDIEIIKDEIEEFENIDEISKATAPKIELTTKKIPEPFKTTVAKSSATMHKAKQQQQQKQELQYTLPPKTTKSTASKHQMPQPLTSTNLGNRELTEFFPVRRSVRKTKTVVKEEMMRSLEQAVLEERADGLKVAHFEGKGRGVIADRRFQRGEFVVEYIGDLISMTEATERERQYALDENAGCYMYYFKHKNQQYCIDATVDTGKLGRLVNHSRNGNLLTKVVVVKQRPHLVLLAKDDILPGEELTYDYGDRSKESLLHHPWLAF